MPAAIVALLPYITAATSALSVGEGIYSAVKGSGGGVNEQALKAQQQQQANEQALQKQQAINANVGQAQAQTGGSLAGDSFQSFVKQLAGFPGSGGTNPQVAGSTSTTVGGQTTPDISSILAMLQSNQQPQISGGSGTTQQSVPQGRFELSSPVM